MNQSRKYLIYAAWAILLMGALCGSLMCLPFLVFFSPFWISVGLLVKLTRLGTYLNKYYLAAYDWLFYQSDKPRKVLWQFIYDSMCVFYPQQKWSTMNYGYAVLNSNGKSINNVNEEERFCL